MSISNEQERVGTPQFLCASGKFCFLDANQLFSFFVVFHPKQIGSKLREMK